MRLGPGAQPLDAVERAASISRPCRRVPGPAALARHLAGEQAARQREVRDEPEPEPLAGRQQLVLRAAREPRVFALLRDETPGLRSPSPRSQGLRRVVRRAVRADRALARRARRAPRSSPRAACRDPPRGAGRGRSRRSGAAAAMPRAPRGCSRASRGARAVAHRACRTSSRARRGRGGPASARPSSASLPPRVAVDVRGVEEGDAGVERRVHDRARGCLVEPAAEVVAAEADDGAPRAGRVAQCASRDRIDSVSALMRYWEDFRVGDVTELGPVDGDRGGDRRVRDALRPAAVPHRSGGGEGEPVRRPDRERLAHDGALHGAVRARRCCSTRRRSAHQASRRSAGRPGAAGRHAHRPVDGRRRRSRRRRTRAAARSSRPTRCSTRTASS